MATEEYKDIVKVLAKDYLTLKAEMTSEGYSDTALTFKDYLNYYAKYEEAGLLYVDEGDTEDYYDDDEIEYEDTIDSNSTED